MGGCPVCVGVRILSAGEAVTHHAYYNEIDPFAAAWLENLIRAKLIAPGVVDTRSIEDVRPDELTEFTQCHFFAGIGLWSHSFRLAGWPDDRPVWSGSCPCQPFSAAGQGAAFADERHLWPAWHHIIEQCRPVAVFGEQVASKDGLGWVDLVQADMEGTGYAFGALDLCAAGFGAPHIRQRLVFAAFRLADAAGGDTGAERQQRGGEHGLFPQGRGGSIGLEYTSIDRRQQRGTEPSERGVIPGCGISGLADTDSGERHGITGGQGCLTDGQATGRQQSDGQFESGGSTDRTNPPYNPWRNSDWLWCRDEKFRPVEPGTFPLVNGYPARVGVLRAYGNAIVPPKIAAFIAAVMEWKP